MFRTLLLGTAVLLLALSATGCTVTFNPDDASAKAVRETKARIAAYEILKDEQQLTRDILALQIEIAQLKLKAKASPVIEGEFVPVGQLPKQ